MKANKPETSLSVVGNIYLTKIIYIYIYIYLQNQTIYDEVYAPISDGRAKLMSQPSSVKRTSYDAVFISDDPVDMDNDSD